jgi:type VI secretion system secreted protein Hcp
MIPRIPGRETNDAQYDDISIVKEIDKASIKLAEACSKGGIIPKVDIDPTSTYRAARVVYLMYELRNCQLTTCNTTGGSVDGSPPREEVTPSVSDIKVTCTEYDSQGRPKGNVEYSWTK